MSAQCQALSLYVDSLQLEACLHLPTDPPCGAALVSHPHPAYGGSMSNNIVLTLCETMADAGLAAVRFNFRGVGDSQGTSSGGEEEVEDVRQAAQQIKTMYSDLPFFLSGYSFGAWVGLQAALDLPFPKALIAVSPPNAMFDHSFISQTRKPLLIVAGDRDEYCNIDRLLPSLEDVSYELAHTPAADHFWYGQEAFLASAVTSFIKNKLD